MRRALLTILAVCVLTLTLGAQTIKLATLAPPGSPWEQSLRKLGADWTQISRGRVTLKIYAGGIAGDEDDMIRKMRIGQISAVGISGLGLAAIQPDVMAIQIPLLTRNDEELDFLIREMDATFSDDLDKLGYKLLAWTKAGWTYIFSREPVARPDDLKRQKLWVWDGMPDEARSWGAMGFRPVTLATTDLLVQLQSGGIDAFITSPLMAASNQYFAVADNMTVLKWAPLVGAIIVTNSMWNRIPREFRDDLEEAADELVRRYDHDFQDADRQAIELMQQYGLTVHTIPESAQDEWTELVNTGLVGFFNDRFDIAHYHKAQRLVEEYRRANPGR